MSGDGDDKRLTSRPFEKLGELKAEPKRERKKARKAAADRLTGGGASRGTAARPKAAPSKEASSAGPARHEPGLTSRPFAVLGELKAELKREQKRDRKRRLTSGSSVGEKGARASTSPAPAAPRSAEDDLFAEAMADVVPLADRDRVVAPVHEPHGRIRTRSEAQAVDDYLRDLVEGVVPFDISDTDEYIEGAIQGFDRRVLRRLRRGELAIQAHLDLHGCRRDEARAKVTRFIKQAHAKGQRCVLIVHGRGLNSKDQIPVLKEKLKAWLTRGAIGTRVLAFATARPYDGGAGAVYVLLRR